MPVSQIFHNPNVEKYEDDISLIQSQSFLDRDTTSPADIASFHASLDNFMPTPLISHPELASFLGISKVFIKCETSRLGLPAYKILGASYAIYRHLRRILDVPDDETTTIANIASAAQKALIHLVCATDGNHGRAVARMAALLDLPATVYVPSFVPQHTINAIYSERRNPQRPINVTRVPGDYLQAERAALKDFQTNPLHHLIQDNQFPELKDDFIISWIMAGYRTIFHEIDSTLGLHNCDPDLVVVPVGVGSLAQTAAMHYNRHNSVPNANSDHRSPKIMTVEPTTASSLFTSLRAGKIQNIQTGDTILTGLNCGTVSPLAFPILKKSVDFATTVEDWDAHEGVLELRGIGIDAGPIAGACTRAVRGMKKEELGLNRNSVVVVVATEGRRDYDIPTKLGHSKA